MLNAITWNELELIGKQQVVVVVGPSEAVPTTGFGGGGWVLNRRGGLNLTPVRSQASSTSWAPG